MFPNRSSSIPGNWRKSTYSSADGDCVEVAGAGGIILVRDSKAPDGPMVALTSAAWRALTAAVRAGRV